MGRRTNKQQLMDKIEQLREAIPDIALRTTLIAGFPGETTEAHEEMMQFVNDMEFDRLGCFAYSAEEDTPAAGFADQVPQELKEIVESISIPVVAIGGITEDNACELTDTGIAGLSVVSAIMRFCGVNLLAGEWMESAGAQYVAIVAYVLIIAYLVYASMKEDKK
mgnify:CR=1 FL=1